MSCPWAAVAAVFALLFSQSYTVAQLTPDATDDSPVDCAGDCGSDGNVSEEDLAHGIRLVFDPLGVVDCEVSAFAGDATRVTAADLTRGAIHATEGCNQAPFVPRPKIYRTYPGFEVGLPIAAIDHTGQPLHFTSTDLPEGAALDEETGLLSWFPAPDQLGPFYVPFTVSDMGVPPLSADGTLVFKVSPLDACTIPECDPATGCQDTLVPLSTSCCSQGPVARVAEPTGGCPEGVVLFIGRNVTNGFGRMQNCDRLQASSFAQSGTFVRVRFEARCVNAILPVTIQTRIEVAGRILTYPGHHPPLQYGADGYARSPNGSLGLWSYQISGIPVASLEGAEANVTVTLADVDNRVVTERLRIVLTRQSLGDLPDIR